MKHLLPAVQRTALRIPWAAVGGCAAALLLTAAAPGGQYAPWALAAVAAARPEWHRPVRKMLQNWKMLLQKRKNSLRFSKEVLL